MRFHCATSCRIICMLSVHLNKRRSNGSYLACKVSRLSRLDPLNEVSQLLRALRHHGISTVPYGRGDKIKT